MQYNQLGQTDLRVSEICLGTMTFGEQNTIDHAHEQLDVAVDSGVNFIDTAELYPVPARADTQGRSEEMVGAWLSRGRRDRVIVATKITGQGRPMSWIRNGSFAINRANVRRALDESLRRLKTDYVDLYQIHWPDRYVPIFGQTEYDPSAEWPATPVAEQLEALAEVIDEGKVRYIGLSNETAWGVVEFSYVAQRLGLPRVVSVQNAYNLLNRAFDSALAETARHESVGLLAYSPLAFGQLTGKHLEGSPKESRFARFKGFGARYHKPNVAEATRAYVELAREVGLSPAHLALAFVRSRWFVTSTIIGATTRSQLEENLGSVEVTLDAEVHRRIDAIHARYPTPAP